MNSSEYLSRKKFTLLSSPQELFNNSVQRITTSLNQAGSETNLFTINPDVFNSKLKYLYSVEKLENTVYDRANTFPLLLINNSNCDFNIIMTDYSIDRINYYLNFLKNDQYEEVFSNLSTDETQKILFGLYKLKISVSECFTNIINLYESMFLSIKYFYFLYGEYLNNQINFNKYKDDSEILNNITKLKEYLKKMQINLNEVTVVAIKSSKLTIKPEYLKYIELYGVPYKTIFDEVLLQDIIDKMYK